MSDVAHGPFVSFTIHSFKIQSTLCLITRAKEITHLNIILQNTMFILFHSFGVFNWCVVQLVIRVSLANKYQYDWLLKYRPLAMYISNLVSLYSAILHFTAYVTHAFLHNMCVTFLCLRLLNYFLPVFCGYICVKANHATWMTLKIMNCNHY